MKFRFAVREDTPLILTFIKELAAYEKMLDEVVADEKTLEEWIFDKQKAEVIFVLDDEAQAAGFALFFHNFSTFLGRAGIYLEDLYVRPETDAKRSIRTVFHGPADGSLFFRIFQRVVFRFSLMIPGRAMIIPTTMATTRLNTTVSTKVITRINTLRGVSVLQIFTKGRHWHML